MSNEEMLVADLVLRSLAAFCILLWTPVVLCWVVCFIAWVKGYPETMTVAEVIERLAGGVTGTDGGQRE